MRKCLQLLLLFLILPQHSYTQTIVTDIYDVQQNPALIGQSVAVIGIVTSTTGIFHQEVTYVADTDGGPWGGIVLRDRTANFSAVEGDKLRVIGTVIEHAGITEIMVDQFWISTKDNPLPAVVQVQTSDIATGSPTAESFESVLVQVNNVTVINDNLGNGEWLVDDGSGACRIDNEAEHLTYDIPVIGTEITSIIGILAFKDDNPILLPRSRADIVDNGTTPEYNIYTIQQNSTLVGQQVTVTGLTTVATGIFHPNKTYIEEPNGGPWSGILVWDSTATFQANEGDKVRIGGEVMEKNGLTEISVSSYEILSTGHPSPLPEVVKTADISTKGE